MTGPSQGPTLAAERGGGGGAHQGANAASPLSQDRFEDHDDETPFLQDHRDYNDNDHEHESFIDATTDSYHAPRNPFADQDATARTGVEDMQKKKNRLQENSGSAAYDSFDSLDEDDSDEDSDRDSYSSDDGRQHGGGYQEPEDDNDDDEEADMQRLLVTSTNTKLGGMGMGMRAGETGTGTTIGLDLEPHGYRSRYGGEGDGDYDTLPLSTMDVEAMKMKDRNKRETGSHEYAKGHRIKDSGRKGRGKRKKRSQGQTGIDGTDGMGAVRSEQIAAIAKKQFRVQMLWNAFYVFAWYTCSTALSFYNKWLFSPAYHNFRFPLFTTSLHMVAQFLLSSLTLALLPALRPKAAPSTRDFG
jgi:hypothetical protein